MVESNPKAPPVGRLRITGFLAENEGMAGLSVQFNPFDAMRVDLEDSVFRHCVRTDSFFPTLYLQGLDAEGRPAGNLHFNQLTVEDDIDRAILKIRDRRKNGIKKITGNIILKHKGQTTSIAINDTWLKTMGE